MQSSYYAISWVHNLAGYDDNDPCDKFVVEALSVPVIDNRLEQNQTHNSRKSNSPFTPRPKHVLKWFD